MGVYREPKSGVKYWTVGTAGLKRNILVFAGIFILVICIITGYLLYNSLFVPTNYAECVKNYRNHKNKVTCFITYTGKSSEPSVKKCLDLGGKNPIHIDGPNGCDISFVNPNFVYPTTFEECKKMAGDIAASSIMLYDGGCVFTLSYVYKDHPANVNYLENCPQDYELTNRNGAKTCEKTFPSK